MGGLNKDMIQELFDALGHSLYGTATTLQHGSHGLSESQLRFRASSRLGTDEVDDMSLDQVIMYLRENKII